jgi:hypothetical protein
MCGTYRPEDGNFYRAHVPPSEALVERARAIEAGMEGARVPEEAWQAFFSSACGAIEWSQFERMFHARKAAATYLAIESTARRRVRPASTAFRCVAD